MPNKLIQTRFLCKKELIIQPDYAQLLSALSRQLVLAVLQDIWRLSLRVYFFA